MRVSRGMRGSVAVAVALVTVLAACSSDDGSTGGAAPSTAPGGGGSGTTIAAAPFEGDYEATIVRTAEGIPHITGANIESVIYGQGYASGEDYACTLADQMLKVQGRRAEALGAGDADANVNSDFAWRTIGIDALARKDFPDQSDEVRAQMEAFAAGWNQHLADVGADGVTGWCAGAEWLVPITAEDLYSYARSIALNASSTQVARYLGKVQPPAATEATPIRDEASTRAGGPLASPVSASVAEEVSRGLAPFAQAPQMASNGWAIGRERAADGGGMLVANPHFPWEGELRFWESHLTVAGGLSIYGAQLEGLPGIGIGFTDEFGWTHTVSAGNRFTAYTLELVPGKPTSYVYDDGEKEMTSRSETVQVRQEDGTLVDQTRTLWFSEYGPILDFPGVGWTPAMTVTYRDANLENDEFIEQYLAMDQARSFDEFKEAHATYQGVPLFNTIAVSKDGEAWYADTSATPNLSPEGIAAYEAALAAPGMTAIAADSGAVLLDGSDSIYQWADAPGARDPGLVPYSEMPQTERADYVFNANDSFWLPNADHVLEGDFSPLHGPQGTARSPRTRENATVLSDTSPSGPSGEDGRLDLDELRDLALLNRGFTSRSLKDAVVERCRAATVVDVPELVGSDGAVALPAESVDISQACSVLDAWDGTYDLESVGAIVWRELIGRYTGDDLTGAGALWAEPFDAADPVTTPSGLAPAPDGGVDPVLVNLGRSVQIITEAGFAVDTPLGEVQLADRGGTLVPIHGGNSGDGVTNVVGYSGSFGSTEPFPKRGTTVAPQSGLTADGYRINNGTSFLMALAYGDSGPEAYAFLTYGNTGDRSSPLFSSQTERFSNKDWRKILFTAEAVAAEPKLSEKTVSSS